MQVSPRYLLNFIRFRRQATLLYTIAVSLFLFSLSLIRKLEKAEQKIN